MLFISKVIYLLDMSTLLMQTNFSWINNRNRIKQKSANCSVIIIIIITFWIVSTKDLWIFLSLYMTTYIIDILLTRRI